MLANQQTAEDVASALNAMLVHDYRVEIVVRRGVTRLSGVVADEEARDAAEGAAATVAPGRRLVSCLTVNAERPDAAIFYARRPRRQPGAIADDDTIEIAEHGRERYEAEDFDGAIADFTKAIEICPEFAVLYCHRGLCWHRKNELQRAFDDYTEAINRNPRYLDPLVWRGEVQRARREIDDALDDFNRAIDLDPKQAGPLILRSYIWRSKRDWVKAIADCSQALTVDPKNQDALRWRACYLRNTGDFNAALADLAAAIEIDPTDAFSLAERDRIAKRMDELERSTDE
jgi:tetratricopeptide (TPR) repeat protein